MANDKESVTPPSVVAAPPAQDEMQLRRWTTHQIFVLFSPGDNDEWVKWSELTALRASAPRSEADVDADLTEQVAAPRSAEATANCCEHPSGPHEWVCLTCLDLGECESTHKEVTDGDTQDGNGATDRTDHGGDQRTHQTRSVAAGESPLQPNLRESVQDSQREVAAEARPETLSAPAAAGSAPAKDDGAERWALMLPEGVSALEAKSLTSGRLLSDADCFQWVKVADLLPSAARSVDAETKE